MKHALALLLTLIVSTATAAPTTQPADSTCRVEVKTFQPLTQSPDPAPFGQALRDNMIASLARAHFQPTTDNTTAQFIISGSWQSAGDQLRFTGQITESSTGNIVGGLSATGPISERFAIEDTLCHQALQQLHRLTTPVDAAVVDPTLTLQIPSMPVRYAVDQRGLLISELDSHRTVSNDYQYQASTARDNQTYGFGQTDAYSFGYGYGFGYANIGRYSYNRGFYSNAWFAGRHLPLR